jgi:hypothetical protein
METQTPIEVEPPQQKKPEPSGLRVLFLVVGGIFGMAAGRYCGWLLVIPLALAFGVGGVMTKLSAGPALFRFALALVAAQALYLAVDIVMGGVWLQDALHILLLTAGFAWLWLRPGIGPVILLSVYQVATGLLIASVYWGAQIGTWQHKSLVAQACLRGAVIAFLVSGYIRLRKGEGGKKMGTVMGQS